MLQVSVSRIISTMKFLGGKRWLLEFGRPPPHFSSTITARHVLFCVLLPPAPSPLYQSKNLEIWCSLIIFELQDRKNSIPGSSNGSTFPAGSSNLRNKPSPSRTYTEQMHTSPATVDGLVMVGTLGSKTDLGVLLALCEYQQECLN